MDEKEPCREYLISRKEKDNLYSTDQKQADTSIVTMSALTMGALAAWEDIRKATTVSLGSWEQGSKGFQQCYYKNSASDRELPWTTKTKHSLHNTWLLQNPNSYFYSACIWGESKTKTLQNGTINQQENTGKFYCSPTEESFQMPGQIIFLAFFFL